MIYNGIKDVPVIGEYKIELNNDEYSSIIKAIEGSDFNNLEDDYESSNALDFSKTIISYNDKKVSIRLWKDAPEELTNLYVAIEDILYKNKFLE